MIKFGISLCRSPAARNAAASYFAFASVAASGLISIPIAVQFLEKEQIGLWAVVNAILSYLLWMDLGVGEATGRKIADAVAAKDQLEINRWWSTTRAVLAVQAVLLISLGLGLAHVFVGTFDIPPSLKSEAFRLFAGAVLVAGCSMPLRGVPGLLIAQQRFHWASLGQGVFPWVNLATFYLMLKLGWGISSYLFAMFATQLLTWVYYTILVKTGPQAPAWDRSGITRERITSLFRFSVSLSFMGIIDAIVTTLPTLILARFGGLALVPVFNFTSKAPLLLVSLVNRTIWAFYPGLLRLQVEKKQSLLLVKHRLVGMTVFAIGLFAAGGVIAFNQTLVGLLAGESYYAGHLTNAVLAAAILVEPVCHLFRCMLHLGGSMGRASLIAAANLMMGVVVSVIGFKWLGLPGLALLSILLPIPLGFYGYFHGGRSCGFIRGSIAKAVVVLTGIAAIFAVVAGWWMENRGGSGSHIGLLGKMVGMPTVPMIAISAVFFLIAVAAGFRVFKEWKVVRVA